MDELKKKIFVISLIAPSIGTNLWVLFQVYADEIGYGDLGCYGATEVQTPNIGFDYYYGVPLVNSHAPFVFVENRHVVGLDPKDPSQSKNVILEYPEIAAELKKELDKIKKEKQSRK